MTIMARPTLYEGITFRSNLEATWAALFDILGWEWHYEPFPLQGWLPDFAISAPNTEHGHVLVEVKPISLRDLNVERKLERAAPDQIVMICGVGPSRMMDEYPLFRLGSILDPDDTDEEKWATAFVERTTTGLSLANFAMPWGLYMGGDSLPNSVESRIFHKEGRALWGKAKTLTRYEPNK